MADERDALGDRMKTYEAQETSRRFLPMLPIYARVDGRSFSGLTRGMDRPFDPRFTAVMVETAKALVEHTHARIAYVQSDEISLVWQTDAPESSLFFDGKVMKMASILAGLATAAFTRALLSAGEDFAARAVRLPHFDCRVIQMPTRTEAVNMLLWRNQDATKNAISMAARHYYSAKALHGRSGPEMQEMMFAKGVNFNDYPPAFKRGTWVRRVNVERGLTQDEMDRIPEAHRPATGALVVRSEMRAFDLPRLSSVVNREAVVFDGADPIKEMADA